MAQKPVWTSEASGRGGLLDPAAIRAIVRMWELHRTGRTWVQVGKELGTHGGDVEIAFNQLIDSGLQAGHDELWAINDAYESHYPDCDDCDGPTARSVGGTQAPG